MWEVGRAVFRNLVLYLNEWHVMVFFAGPLDELINLGALDGRGSGEDQLCGGGGQCAPVSLENDVAKLGGKQLPLGQQGVTQGDDGPGHNKSRLYFILVFFSPSVNVTYSGF